ncbi:hypothetical protein XENOCAPTIV_025743, partial [Xenoophorus captivus]
NISDRDIFILHLTSVEASLLSERTVCEVQPGHLGLVRLEIFGCASREETFLCKPLGDCVPTSSTGEPPVDKPASSPFLLAAVIPAPGPLSDPKTHPSKHLLPPLIPYCNLGQNSVG